MATQVDNEQRLGPDQLEGFAHPRQTTQLIGHDRALAELIQLFTSGRMHHGWVLAGPAGIGKATLAYAFARSVLSLAEGEALSTQEVVSFSAAHPVYRQIAGGAHPNLLAIQRGFDEKTKRFASEIKVDDVRRLRGFLHTTSAGLGWRIVIVDKADEMNISASNALLKSLEEPPERCFFLLICAQPGRLPATILSRCRRLTLDPLPHDAFIQAIGAVCTQAEQKPPDAKRMAQLIPLARGSVRRALELYMGGGLEISEMIDEFCRNLPSIDYRRVHKLAERLSARGNDIELQLFFSILGDWLQTMVRSGAGVGTDGEDPQRGLAGSLNVSRALPLWAELWQRIMEMSETAATLNLDKTALIIETITLLEQTARESKSIS